MMERITKIELAERLANRVELADDLTPERGLEILLYGWMNYRRFSDKYRHAVHARDYLFITELLDLSAYAQCDLTEKVITMTEPEAIS